MENTRERDIILNALAVFIRQKPGMEPSNYDFKGYNSERRDVHKDLQHAEKLLAAVRWRHGIGPDQLKEAFKRAFSGRLTWDDAKQRLDYCTGQYFPTEYRKAACAVLASALWEYWRNGRDQFPTDEAARIEARKENAKAIRKSAKKEFGLTIAKRYFDYRASDYK